MKMKRLNWYSLIWVIFLFVTGCTSPTTNPSTPMVMATTTMTTSPATPTVLPSATPAPKPTQVPTPTLAPMGEIQPIQDGYVYLGDPKEMALGFNLHAGGAIGSLRYRGVEMVDDSDFGRYIQFSPYDGADQYICNSSSCFVTWGWNPLQAGSADGQPARVLEYRRWLDGLYIKAPGQEWGRSKGVSDVVYETWAWDRNGYFEVHTRMTHTGEDTHTSAGAESPAAYFGAAIPLEYGYTGTEPFTGDKIQTYQMVTGDMSQNANPDIFPSENWMAFGDQKDNGLILAVPPQPKLTGAWSMVFIQNAYPAPIGYLAPFAQLETTPGFVFDLTYYLIPGPLAQGRSIVYDLIPHTTWTFNLDTTEGWSNAGQTAKVYGGVLMADLSPTNPLTSIMGLNSYGAHYPLIDMTARTQTGEAELCLNFVTLNDWNWGPDKTSCVQVQAGDFKDYRFDFSTNPAWMNGLVTQLQLRPSTPATLEIDGIRMNREIYGWEFDNPNDSDGWSAWNQLEPFQKGDGSIISTSTGDDPYMGSPFLSVDAAGFSRIEIRMRNSAGNDAQIFFVTDKDPAWDEIKSRHFSITGDGAYHTYTVNMSGVGPWKDRIQQIRLDPMTVPGDFEIDYIRITRP
jgi:hypothetical protein